MGHQSMFRRESTDIGRAGIAGPDDPITDPGDLSGILVKGTRQAWRVTQVAHTVPAR